MRCHKTNNIYCVNYVGLRISRSPVLRGGGSLVEGGKRKNVFGSMFHQKIPKTVAYSFDDAIPGGIWDGKCVVDFKYIYSQVEFMY